MRYRIGSKVMMTSDAVNNYGKRYAGKVFTVESASNKYMPAKEFYANDMPKGYHPGYAGDGEGLYDLKGLAFSLYDWELIPA